MSIWVVMDCNQCLQALVATPPPLLAAPEPQGMHRSGRRARGATSSERGRSTPGRQGAGFIFQGV